MNAKEKLKNDILVGMRVHLDATTSAILEAIIVKSVQNIEITELETLPATVDNTNQYIVELFMARKAIKLSKKTVNRYLETINELVTLVNKPLNKMSESDIEYYLQVKKPNNSNRSLNNLRRNLSAFYTWMRRDEDHFGKSL